jgi:hypothetical protein
MRAIRFALVLAALAGTAACGRSSEAKRAEAVDLSWLDTVQFQNVARRDTGVVSPLEMGLAAAPAQKPAEPVQAVAEEKKETRSSTSNTSSRRRTSTARRSSSSAGTWEAPARQPRVVTVKHTKRDAAIGAAGGAVIGAVAGGSRHRVKGAVIGGVAGAIAGAVIGNNVDKSRRVQY